MTGVDHRSPGMAVAALLDDEAWVELIADGIHVDPAIWQLIRRLKPPDRLLLVSDALPIAGTGALQGTIGGLKVEVRDGRVTLAGTSTLAGCAVGLDTGIRNLVRSGTPLPDAIAAATRAPLALLGVDDRGRIAVGQRGSRRAQQWSARPSRHAAWSVERRRVTSRDTEMPSDRRQMFRFLPWPFPDGEFPRDLGAVVQVTVLDGEMPALLVIHDSEGDRLVGDGFNDLNIRGCQRRYPHLARDRAKQLDDGTGEPRPWLPGNSTMAR